MPRDSARSLRAAVVAVGALGALSLSVPASLWMAPGGVFPVLHPVAHTVQASGFDSAGRQLASPARLRPGSSTEIVVTGFAAAEPVLLRHSAAQSPCPVAGPMSTVSSATGSRCRRRCPAPSR